MSHQDGYKIKNHKEYERFQEEYRKQEKERNSGVNNAMHGKSVYSVWVEKYGKEEADKKLKNQSEKQSKSISGINNPNFGKKGSLHYKFGKKDSEETRNKKSGKNHHGYVHFSKEEESLIFELRKQKLSYPKIIDIFFENFNKKISRKIIPRVIRECKN